MHIWPIGQALPHSPQLARLSARFTQAPAQITWSPEQAWHLPSMHARPGGHAALAHAFASAGHPPHAGVASSGGLASAGVGGAADEPASPVGQTTIVTTPVVPAG